MNVPALKAILASVTSSLACPNDQVSYREEDLVVVSAIDRRAVLVAQCSSCKAAVLVTAAVQIANEANPIATKALKSDNLVTLEDVSSIHEVLRDFNGDITALIKADE